MISIKKYLDQRDKPRGEQSQEPLTPVAAVVEEFRALLSAFARTMMFDGTPHGAEFGSKLLALYCRIGIMSSPLEVHEAEAEAETNLGLWGHRVSAEMQAKNEEIKELIRALATTAESIGMRDKKNAFEICSLTENLETLGNLSDIRQIRSTLVKHVAQLRTTVEQMQQESRDLLANLQSKVTAYETKLKSVENLALTDGLTGVANRRGLEQRIACNIASNLPFCVALFDLNRFKDINDSFGHAAGDDLLRQFANILGKNSRVADMVGRWGGDEFVLVLTGIGSEARSHIERLREATCTQYQLCGNNNLRRTVDIDAAVGLAEWISGETVEQIVAKADAEMYQDKRRLNSRFGHTRKTATASDRYGALA